MKAIIQSIARGCRKIIKIFFGKKAVSLYKMVWARLNDWLKDGLRRILSKDILENLLYFSLIILLIAYCLYAFYEIAHEIKKLFSLSHKKTEDTFPAVLEFSEDLFIYFLPVFILFGLFNFYKLEWRRILVNTDKPNYEDAQRSLNLSKRLFFSSLLSYTSLKIIDKLFFEFESVTNTQIIYTGLFFLLLVTLVLFQHKQSDG